MRDGVKAGEKAERVWDHADAIHSKTTFTQCLPFSGTNPVANATTYRLKLPISSLVILCEPRTPFSFSQVANLSFRNHYKL